MSRKLASIVEVASCDPIPDTDRLSVATMKGKGWRVVTARDEYKPGDLAVYFEIDSALPPDDSRYAFLRERCLRKFVSKSGRVLREVIRIKTVKLRGVISQGLLMPFSAFPEIPREANMGADVTTLLHIEHFDEIKESLQPAMGNPICADALGKFPSDFVPKTDEERIQNLGDWFASMKGRLWQVTQKHDGTSCTIAYSPSIDSENPEIVCSRNLRLKPQTADGKIPVHWQMAEKYGIIGSLKYQHGMDGREFALQGEIVGPGINKCRNKETEYKFLCFRIWNVKEQQFLNPQDASAFCSIWKIPHVNVIEDRFPFFDRITTMDEALKFAEGKTPEGNEREGVVCKTVDDGPYRSFKVVSNRYLMKQED